jgi:TonB-dependent starch-binding outer membrane protein SusC
MRKIDVFKKEVLLITLLLLCVHFVSLAQTVRVAGSVKDPSGMSLPGVNIIIVGTTQGSVSDIDGNYAIETDANSTLQFNFLGFSVQDIPVNGRTIIDVTLREDLLRLDEVVVVGYGVQRKSDITGAITSVDVEALRDVASSSISRALQGKTAGVEIQNLNTKPGGNTQIRIRGNRSLTASNDPLLIVDGIPYSGSLNDIATDDVESIEILKDASATVIYGSRGANGVIILTTKRGKTGKARVSYNGYSGVSVVSKYYDVYNAEEFTNLRTAAGFTAYSQTEIESMMKGRETDWQDLGFQSGMVSSHEIGVNGGSDDTQYSFSLGYYDESYVISSMGYERFNIRSAIDQQIGSRVKVGISSMNVMALTDGESADPTWSLVSLSPLAVPYNNDGSLIEQPTYGTDDTFSPLTLQDDTRWAENRRNFRSFNTAYMQVDIWNGIQYKLNAGLDFSANKYNRFYGSNTPFRNGSLNEAHVQNQDNLSWTVENLLLWNKTLEKHRFSFTGMQSAQKSTATSSRFTATDVPADYLQYNNFFLADVVQAANNNNYFSEWTLLSYMARFNYVFDDRFLVTLTGRADGSSRLAQGNKWHNYPAVALAWNVSNESFLKGADYLSQLKVRLGYGQTSNTSIDPYRTLGGLNTVHYSYGDRGVMGYYVSSLPNPNLSWEYTTSYNLGIDFGFFHGRLTGSVDAYLQETNDLILGKRLPYTTGVTGAFYENIGETENKGLEFVLNGNILSGHGGGLKWDVNTNLFLNREKIIALQDGVTIDVGNGWFVGNPTTAIYDYEKIGIWQLGEEEEAAKFNRVPGDIKIADQGPEPDGQITSDDRKVIGSQEAKFSGGFSSNWEYRNFDFSVIGYFRVGGTIISTLHMPNDYVNRLDGRRNGIKVDYWTPNNPTNDNPRPKADPGPYTNTLGYFDGSFLKIRSINLGYNFKDILGANTKLRVYGSVTDPFVFFSPYIDAGGINPEPTSRGEFVNNSVGLPNRTLVISLSTPPTTKYIFGVNFSF